MTSARQVRQVFKPLVERHSDLLTFGDRWLWIKPVHHVALRVLIERTAVADYAAPRIVMLETFFLNNSIMNGVGERTWYYRRNSGSSHFWEWSDLTMVDDLVTFIEIEMLPTLRSIKNLECFVEFLNQKSSDYYTRFIENRMIIDIALGRLDAARATCLELLPQYREDKYRSWWLYQNLRTKVMTLAEPLLAGDRAELARILHGWEAANIRGTKIEPYWEPTPFPLERV